MLSVLLLIWNSFLFFLPAFLGNAAPVIANNIKFLNFLSRPIDLGIKFRGVRLLGENKTWRGVLAGVVGGAIGGVIMGILSWLVEGNLLVESWQGWVYLLEFGAAMGFGAIFGDSLKSFVKRRFSIAPGKSWPIFDQIDFIVGAWPLSFFFYSVGANWGLFLCALVMSVPVTITANFIAYKLGWKKVWW